MKKLSCHFIPLLFLLCACQTGNEYKSGKSYEILSKDTYDKLQLVYNSIGDFELGTAIVADSLYGLINVEGKEVLPCIFDTIFSLKDNYRIVRSCDKNYGVVNIDGKQCISCVYENFKPYGYGYFPFKRNNKWGFLEENGEIRIQFKYDDVEIINDSIFMCKVDDKYGLLRYDETPIFEVIYDAIIYKLLGKESSPSFLYLNEKLAIANSKNKLITDFEYDANNVGGLRYIALPQLEKYLELKKNGDKYGLIDYETGKVIIPFKYESLGNISDSLLYAEMNGKYGYINLDNKMIIPFKFEDAENFSEGLARVGIHKGYYNSIVGRLPYNEYGFINKRGDFIIKPTFANPILNSLSKSSEFHEELAAMGIRDKNNMLAQKFGYIDKTGKWVIKPAFDEAGGFIHGVALVKKNKKYGYINKKGELIVDFLYDDFVARYNNDSIIVLEKDGIEYKFNLDGTPLLEK